MHPCGRPQATAPDMQSWVPELVIFRSNRPPRTPGTHPALAACTATAQHPTRAAGGTGPFIASFCRLLRATGVGAWGPAALSFFIGQKNFASPSITLTPAYLSPLSYINASCAVPFCRACLIVSPPFPSYTPSTHLKMLASRLSRAVSCADQALSACFSLARDPVANLLAPKNSFPELPLWRLAPLPSPEPPWLPDSLAMSRPLLARASRRCRAP